MSLLECFAGALFYPVCFIIPSRGGLQNLFPGLKATSATVSARPLGFNDVKKAA